VIKLFGHLLAPEDRGLCLVTVELPVPSQLRTGRPRAQHASAWAVSRSHQDRSV